MSEDSVGQTKDDAQCVSFYAEGSETRKMTDNTVKLSEVGDLTAFDAVFFVGGFGTVSWVDPAEYAAAAPDEVAAHEPAATLRALNETHGSAMRTLLARRRSGQGALRTAPAAARGAPHPPLQPTGSRSPLDAC